jgi:uncharacterized protein YjeT (DUF2065 family)
MTRRPITLCLGVLLVIAGLLVGAAPARASQLTP